MKNQDEKHRFYYNFFFSINNKLKLQNFVKKELINQELLSKIFLISQEWAENFLQTMNYNAQADQT